MSCPVILLDLDDETEDDFPIFLEQDVAWDDYLRLTELMEDYGLEACGQ